MDYSISNGNVNSEYLALELANGSFQRCVAI
jgi:hypothetical protein